ncbi:MAG TPA: hypothetical protein VNG13_00290 [Mycobacteriales bacterium]|nr:hypothetical protein [Mycobacteriales bacterium]
MLEAEELAPLVEMSRAWPAAPNIRRVGGTLEGFLNLADPTGATLESRGTPHDHPSLVVGGPATTDSFATGTRSNVHVDDLALTRPRIFRQWRKIVHDYGSGTDLISSIFDQPGEEASKKTLSLEELPGVVG